MTRIKVGDTFMDTSGEIVIAIKDEKAESCLGCYYKDEKHCTKALAGAIKDLKCKTINIIFKEKWGD